MDHCQRTASQRNGHGVEDFFRVPDFIELGLLLGRHLLAM